MEESKRKDLDETRRLLYMALAAPHTKRYNLAGSLVNALVHHQGKSKLRSSREALIRDVAIAVDGDGDQKWLWDEIDQITRELDAEAD